MKLLEVDTHGIGEIAIRGHNVMKGYWNRPDATAAVIDAEGWFRTGDLARIDEDGYYFIVDRSKDMIILSDFVKERVAAYKYPRRIWFVDELPKGLPARSSNATSPFPRLARRSSDDRARNDPYPVRARRRPSRYRHAALRS